MAALLLLFSGCSQRDEDSASVVAGKAVFAGMGIEGATISALSKADGTLADETLSTYHGSFMLHLPPGAYTLKATAIVPRGTDELAVSGELPEVLVATGRLDRITILMDGEIEDD